MATSSRPPPTTDDVPELTTRQKAYEVVKIGWGYLYDVSNIIKLTILLITIGIIVIITWIFNQAALQENACANLNKIYGIANLKNLSYFNGPNNIRSDAITNFENATYSTLINYHVKSAYNCCCGDGYKNNFVAICALEKSIANGCRFLDFEIYSYNNAPIIASSTVPDNFIKETYNALLLSDVLTIISEQAFDGTKTTCANDPLILNFRVKSTNLVMLENMGNLLEEYLDRSINANFTLLKNFAPGAVLNVQMKDLYKKIIIICTFNPSSNILLDSKLLKLKNLINLDGKGEHCNTFRYFEIVAKAGNNEFINSTKRKYTIVLPDLNNSISNFDSVASFMLGCQAICMKHQNEDGNLEGYNQQFDEVNNRNYSWRLKDAGKRQIT